MKKEDLIIGETYYTPYGTGWILKINSLRDSDIVCSCISNNGWFYGLYSWDTISDFNRGGARLATKEEKTWLNECIKQGRSVPRDQIKVDEIINDYKIY